MNIKKSKPIKKFAIKKTTTTTTTKQPAVVVENGDKDTEIVDEAASTTSTTTEKSILKKKKVEKVVEKKKVIIKTEKNQTQLFNKNLKIADKPIIIKSTTTKKVESVDNNNNNKQEQEHKQEEQPEKPTKPSKKANTKTTTTITTSEELKPTEPITINNKSKKAAAAAAAAAAAVKKAVVEETPIIEEEKEEEAIIVEEPTPKIVKDNNNNNKKNNKKKEVVESESDSSESESEDDSKKKKEKKKENTISGFIILPVQIENSPFKKYIYYKKETNKKWPVNKTLFVTNLPTHCKSLEDAKKLFKFDFIESIHFGQPIFNNNNNTEQTPEQQEIDENTKHVAHIVMKDKDSLNLFLKKSHSLSITQPSLPLNGFDQMLNQFNSSIITDYDALQNKLDNIMMDYDRRVLESKKRSKQRNVPDEEGFITVGPSSAKVMTAEEVKALMEKKEKKNFYAFQHRQNKKDELDVLRQKFEEDKQRISKITAARKFKPY